MNWMMWHDIRKNPLDLPTEPWREGAHIADVLVTLAACLRKNTTTYYVERMEYDFDKNTWYTYNDADDLEEAYDEDNIVAWMYYPKPYIPEKEGENV